MLSAAGGIAANGMLHCFQRPEVVQQMASIHDDGVAAMGAGGTGEAPLGSN
jgi:hypothetical protein